MRNSVKRMRTGLQLQAKARAQSASEGPDFLCIGQQKAGSTWLYDQLKFHPNLWLPPVRELHYLDGRFPQRAVLEVAELAADPHPGAALDAWCAEHRARPFDERDKEFFAAVRAARSTTLSLDGYAELFRFKDDRVAGEIAPSYCRLKENQTLEVTTRFPELKVILLVRDPIERLWSQLSTLAREGRFKLELLEKPKAFERYLASTHIAESAFATHIAQTWLNALPAGEQFLTVFFDDVVARPRHVLRDVLSFLGVYPFFTGPLPVELNRLGNQPKLEMSEAIRAVLIGHFVEEFYAASEMFGGAARQWHNRYGLV